MTVRNVVECTLVIVVLLVLALIGWQTCVVTGDITNLKHDMLTRQDMAEAVRAVAASKEFGGNRPLISLASNVIPAPPDGSEKTGVLPQSSAGTAARGVDADVLAQLKALGDDLLKTKQELADVRAKLDANVEATNIAHVDLGRIIEKDATGPPIVAIRELEANPEFKADFRKAVDDALAPPVVPLGTIRVENRMPVGEYLEVNGIGRWVAPLSNMDVVVPAGVATTRLTGYEPAKTWPLDARNKFFQSVLIEPQPGYTPIIAYP